MRCFISIDIPKEIRDKIKKIQEQLPEFVGKKTEQENLHLTLKFLGEVDERFLIDIKNRQIDEINRILEEIVSVKDLTQIK